jgi:peptidoglycan/xylan/chitin deacetylase (PgdA/CDA1 family)
MTVTHPAAGTPGLGGIGTFRSHVLGDGQRTGWVVSRLLVVGFHNVCPTWFWPDPPGRGVDGLVAQVRGLMRLGTIVPLAEAVRDIERGVPLPRRSIALTFDDGYRDNLTDALPVLERLGVPATFFLVPGFLDRSVDAWWECLAWAVTRGRGEAEVRGHRIVAGNPHQLAVAALAQELKAETRVSREAVVADLADRLGTVGDVGTDRLFMDWHDARRLVGRVDVGSHSGHHEILARETPEAQTRGLADCRARLQRELGVAADLLAYPNGQPGDFDGSTIAAARAAGHLGAVTTVAGCVDHTSERYALDRVVLNPANGLRGLRAVTRAPGFRRFLVGR